MKHKRIKHTHHLLALGCMVSTAMAAAPVAHDDTIAWKENAVLELDFLHLNDTDADGDALSITGVGSPSNGTLVNVGANHYRYTPNSGFAGRDTFTYTLSDGNGGTDTATVTISVNAILDVSAARNALLANVTQLVDPGTPGHMSVWGPTTFSVSNYPNSDESRPMIAAGSLGAGKFIAMPDHQWLKMNTYGGDASMAAFYTNGITWLAGTTSKTISIVTMESGVQTWLQSKGYTNVVVATASNLSSNLQNAVVFIPGWLGNNATQATVTTTNNFVSGGGSLFICDYASGYTQWWNKPKWEIPSNKVLREAGMAFVRDDYVWGAQNINAANDELDLEGIEAVLADPGSASQNEKDIAVAVTQDLIDWLHPDDIAYARLRDVFWNTVNGLTPTEANPVTDAFERALLGIECSLLAKLDPAEMTPHRAALPVDAQEPRVSGAVFALVSPPSAHAEKTIYTPFYAAPGELVTINFPTLLSTKNLDVRIGHLRSDHGANSYPVMPDQVLNFDVDATQVQVASPHGGLIQIIVPSYVTWTGDQSITVSGAVQAPYFKLGETTDAEWVAGVRDRGTPFGVLDSDEATLVIDADLWLRNLNDPEAVISEWNYFCGKIREFYNYDAGRQLIVHHDYFAVGGFATYPQSYSRGSNIVDAQDLKTSGFALVLHEYGHICDTDNIIFDKFIETSPNLGGKWLQQSARNYSWKQTLTTARINNYLSSQGSNFWNDGGDHYVTHMKSTLFELLAAEFGPSLIKDTVWAMTAAPELANSQAKIDEWARQLSTRTGYDMSDLFAAWQIPVSAAADSELSTYTTWLPIERVPEKLLAEQNTPLVFHNPSANDFSYDGTVVLAGFTQPAHGSVTDNGDGMFTYTPAPGYTGQDDFTYTVTNGLGNSFVTTVQVTVLASGSGPRPVAFDQSINNSNWSTITLPQSYTSPVIVGQPVTLADAAPMVVRLRNVGTNSFEAKLARADGSSDALGDTLVRFFVVEEGVYNEATHGIKMEAVKFTSTVTDGSGNFSGETRPLAYAGYDHYFTPVIFGQVMSSNDAAWSSFWYHASSYDLKVGKHVGEDPNTTRANETVGYIVMESGLYQWPNYLMRVGNGGYDRVSGFGSLNSSTSTANLSAFPVITSAQIGVGNLKKDSYTEDGTIAVQRPVSNSSQCSCCATEDTLGDAEQSVDQHHLHYLLASYTGNGPSPLYAGESIQWQLEEGSGTVASDSSGKGSDGTLYGSPTWTADGRVGGGLALDGVDDKVEMPLTERDWKDFTVSVWVKSASDTQNIYSAVFSNYNPNVSGSFQIDLASGYRFSSSDGTASFGPSPVGEWVHLLVSCDGTDTRLYYNGVLSQTLTDASPALFNRICVGLNRNNNQYFAGTVDELMVYDFGLNGDQVAALYASYMQPTLADASFAVTENTSVGTPVGTVLATDATPGDSLTYSITAGNASGAFAIDAWTGEITVASSPDYETTASYQLTVLVTDSSGHSDEATVDIAVQDIAGDDSDGDGLSDEWEVLHFGSVAAQDGSTDSDGDGLTNAEEEAAGTNPNSTDSDGDGFSDSAELAAGTDPNDAGNNPAPRHLVWTGVVDGDFFNEANWDSDDTIAGTQPPSNNSVNPDTALNALSVTIDGVDFANMNSTIVPDGVPLTLTNGQITTSGTIGYNNTAATQSTLTLGAGAAVSFQYIANSDVVLTDDAVLELRGGGNPLNGSFIDLAVEATGTIRFANESVADVRSEHLAKITVDGQPAVEGTNVQLADVNGTTVLSVIPPNNAPVAEEAIVDVAENLPSGTVVGSVIFADPDTGDNHSFAITGGNGAGLFAIDANSGEITTTAALDFESTAQYVLTIEVTDDGTPALSDSATLTIDVTDVNEAPVAVDNSGSVSEDAPLNTLVTTVSATDPDANDSLSFSITAGNTGGAFAIDPSTGEVTVASSLDYETTSTYQLTVLVTDSSGSSDEATVDIAVQDIAGDDSDGDGLSDEWEVLHFGSVAAQDGSTDSDGDGLTNAEEEAAGTNPNSTDSDGDGFSDSAELAAGTDPNDAGNNPAPRHLVWTGVVDGDFFNEANWDSDATIAGTQPPFNNSVNPDTALNALSVTIDGVDFTFMNSTIVPEGVPLTLTNGLITTNGTIGYSITAATQSTLTLGAGAAVSFQYIANSDVVLTDDAVLELRGGGNPLNGATVDLAVDTTGDIRFANESVADVRSEHLAKITVDGQPAVEGTNVQLTDVNGTTVLSVIPPNSAPSVADGNFFTVENSALGSVVGVVSATDPDAGDVLSYAITAGNGGGEFSIDSNTGEITINTNLDHEAVQQYVLTVEVTDTGLLTDTATITIDVTDVNEAPTAQGTAASIAEDAVVDSLVATVAASDPDTGDVLNYAITAGNTGAAFAIDSSGNITTATGLDYESINSYTLTVTVTDSGNLSDTATVNITVTDVLEIIAPAVSTGSASNLTQTSSDIGFSVSDDGGEAAAVTIYYGTSDGGSNAGAWSNSISQGGLTTGNYLTDLSGLTEGTQYYYTVRAVNSAGEVWGSTGSFTTVADTSPKLVRTMVSGVGNSSWSNVDLGRNYNSAVIIATPVYPNSSVPPVVTRIRNVSGSGFEVKIDRVDGQSGAVSCDVSIIAVEEGVYTVASDGVKMEAVKYTSTVTGSRNAWTAESRSYQNSYTSPVVIGQVMSANDPDWSTFWSHGSSRTEVPDSSNLNVGKMVAEDPNDTRAAETVGYIVIESGNGTINGLAYTAGVGSDTVQGTGNTSTGFVYSLNGLSSASAAAVSQSGMDGSDGSWAALYGANPITPTQLTIVCDEDLLKDNERNHTTEQCAYIVFE
ncbi:MAG: cadherin domain-containing protein [Akkermansiaceae bacterium]|nr:cadherin domain-containing protein [Akkermansiaceae bacterium]